MKKLFLTICFTLTCFAGAEAKIKEVLDSSQIPEPTPPNRESSTQLKQITPEELENFLTSRIEKTVIKNPKDIKNDNIFVEPSEQARMSEEQAKKGTFQKIYESAINRIAGNGKDDHPQADAAMPQFTASVEQQQQEWDIPDFPVINVTLPGGRKTPVPAMEHIPYLMNQIEVLPDGMVTFNETAVIIANGSKLKYGLTKMLPKYIYSREGKRQKISYAILGVEINNQEIPYKIIEGMENVLLVPKDDFTLDPGVYNYNFKYAADNLLWNYGDFKELYWDVSGTYWNLVIGQSGATLTLPSGKSPLGQEVYLGSPLNLDSGGVKLLHPSENTWGYAAQRPLFIGEGMHLIVSLPEDSVMAPTLFKKITRLFDAYGDIIISFLTFLTVLVSFIISWRFIRAEKGLRHLNFQKSAAMARYLIHNRYDLKSFGAFLLELFRRNIIDIQKAGDTILLIKRTDNLKMLSNAQQKAVKQLFGNNEAVFNICRNNLLKVKRSAQILESELKRKLRMFILRLNGGYLFFSGCMLLCGELFISLLGNNPLQSFAILALSTLCMAAGIILFKTTPYKMWQNILCKASGTLIVAFAYTIMAALLSLPAAAIILFTLVVITFYVGIYGQRNGLLKPHIKEAATFKEYLIKHHDNIVLGREIANQQPYILALDMEDPFMCEGNEYNKLDAVIEAIQKLEKK